MKEVLELEVITEAMRRRATDIHIDPMLDGYSVRYRVDGRLFLWRKLDKGTGEKLINQFKSDVGIEPGTVFHPRAERRKLELEGRWVDLRVSFVPCISGPKLAIRVLDSGRVQKRLPALGLGAHESTQLERWLGELNGMFLVTGPTASGKTTTAYSMLHELVEESRHVVTIEDPVEYEIDGINQMQVDLRHGLGFAEGVQTSLRLDPDCLMVGEIRDANTAQHAFNAAVQGHVVIATLHSRDSVSTVTRLRNFHLEDHQIAAALGVVVNQRLVGKLCPDCSSDRKPAAAEVQFLESNDLCVPETCGVAPGCGSCKGTGISGRTGIFDVWNLNQSDYEMILAGADEESIREKLQRSLHNNLLEDAQRKIEAGAISVQEVMRLGLDLPWENQ